MKLVLKIISLSILVFILRCSNQINKKIILDSFVVIDNGTEIKKNPRTLLIFQDCRKQKPFFKHKMESANTDIELVEILKNGYCESSYYELKSIPNDSLYFTLEGNDYALKVEWDVNFYILDYNLNGEINNKVGLVINEGFALEN